MFVEGSKVKVIRCKGSIPQEFLNRVGVVVGSLNGQAIVSFKDDSDYWSISCECLKLVTGQRVRSTIRFIKKLTLVGFLSELLTVFIYGSTYQNHSPSYGIPFILVIIVLSTVVLSGLFLISEFEKAEIRERKSKGSNKE